MANWAVVIGIDRYWSEGAHLRGAVRDALAMRKWLLDTAGGNVPPDNLQLVLAPGPNSEPVPEELQSLPIGTKANIIVAINNLIQLSGGSGERLYFFYAGHGLTARVSNRDESALLATDFTSVNTDHSLALRSLWEYFETTQFADQFFFVDACRNVPPWEEGAEFELGRWTLPRSRDPGVPPVQQFILYATSPKLKATEVRLIPGAEHGVFTAALLDGLRGVGTAKAWSWERNVYEVRWERLADYVKERVVRERRPVAETPEGKVLIQVPQDTGSRGVADRERDVAVTSFPPSAFPKERLEVFLEPSTAYPEAEVRVLDALGDVVASQVGGTGDSVVFELAPRTYVVRAESRTYGAGRVPAPIDLYEALADKQRPKILLRLPEQQAEAEAGPVEAAVPAEPTAAAAVEIATEAAATRGVETVAEGTIPLTAPDPLSIVEVKDETGRVVEVGRVGPKLTLPPGFYRLGHVGPERALATPVVALQPGEVEKRVRLNASKPEPVTLQLLEQMGGKTGVANTIKVPDCAPAAWAQSSTLVAMALGKALNGEKGAAALDLTTVAPARRGAGRGGIALYVVSDGDELDIASFDVRVWEARHPVSRATKQLRLVGPRLAELVLASKPGPIWLSIKRRKEGRPMVFALTVLRDHQTTVVVQITTGIRLFQYQPALAGGSDALPETMRRVEYLERMLLSGRLDGAQELALELKGVDDPFIGCLCGYVLLRLGRWKDLHEVVERVVETAPQLADGFVLRGEHAAATKDPGAKQAFAEAVGAGVPVFAEGLTRLLEGLRARDIQHPRSAIVRYVFANHMRGSMWSVFTPSRFQPGKLVVTGADTGLEA